MTILTPAAAQDLIDAFTGVLTANIAGLLLIFGTLAAINFVFRKLGKTSRGRV